MGEERGAEDDDRLFGCSKCRLSAAGCRTCNCGKMTLLMQKAFEIRRLAVGGPGESDAPDLEALDKLCLVGEEGDAGGFRRKVYVTDDCRTSERLRLAGVVGSEKW